MPLYGDLSIFNPAPPAAEEGGGEEGEKVLWGELEVVVEEEEEEVAEEEEEEEEDDHKSGIQSTLPSGMDTPSQFELRKVGGGCGLGFRCMFNTDSGSRDARVYDHWGFGHAKQQTGGAVQGAAAGGGECWW
jgi:hypothetical protein